MNEEKLQGKVSELDEWDCLNGNEVQTEKICFEVYNNYDTIKADLEEVKRDLINSLGQLEQVHLQSGRVKSKNSLIEKIVRKRHECIKSQTSDYAHLNSSNYADIITDLAGIRLIINYRGKWQDIHNEILKSFPLKESELYEGVEHLPHSEGEKFLAEIPVVYYAKDDSTEQYKQANLKTKQHEQGYRSIHYVISYKRCYAELQVRTIYDEAWSDCDHSYVYKHDAKPNNAALRKLSDILCKVTNVANDIGDNMHDVFIEDRFSGADGDIWIASSEDIEFFNDKVKKLKEVEEDLAAFVNNILQEYIRQNQYEDREIICQNIVEHIVVDYFVDIARLKEFQEIEFVNEIKIYSYLSYWMLRHKPLQITACDGQDDLVFVNEECVADFLCSFLFAQPDNVPFIAEQKPQIDEFSRTLRYHLVYRSYSAQNIELMLLAFNAGRGYQYSVDYQH